jgi:hypothetical protein
MADPSSRHRSHARGPDGRSTIRVSPIREGATMNRAQSLSEISASIPQPLAPETVDESGLDPQFLLRFVLKSIYVTNFETAEAHADYIKMPEMVVHEVLESAKDKRLVEVLGLSDTRRSAYRYALTGLGRDWAVEALSQCSYVGPAPVPIDAYRAQVAAQSITRDQITPAAMALALGHLVLPKGTIERLGPAANSAKAMLLYGAPGNGKTSIAMAIGSAFHQSIFLPYCIEADGQIIRLYDPSVHVLDEEPLELPRGRSLDPRWVHCHRPVVMTGGELTIEMLDLSFDPISKFYEAPAHVKATGGVFIADDLGRQRVEARDLINRWILPLERRIDFLTLHTGKKIELPFDQLVVFSTNTSPQAMIDAAGLRRIPYTFHVPVPTREEYAEILRQVSDEQGLVLPDEVVPYLLDDFYPKTGVAISSAHPKFVVDHVIERCRFSGIPPQVTLELVHDAVENLVIDGEPPPIPRHS